MTFRPLPFSTAILLLVYAIFVEGHTAHSQTKKANFPAPPEGILFERDIAYREGHPRWVLNMIVPEKKSSRPRPAVILVHGGGWYSGDQYKFTRMGYSLAEEGYVVMLPTYRLVKDAAFPACIEDFKNSVRWLRANAEKYNVDPEAIGAYGNSAGGTIALTAALTNGMKEFEGDGPFQDYSSDLQAVVGSGTVGDMLHESHSGAAETAYLNLARGPDGGMSDAKVKRALKSASPSTYISRDSPPLLLVHGTDDTVVIINSTDEFVEEMEKVGGDITYLRYEGSGHGVMGQNGKETTPAMLKFFKKHL